MPVGKALSTAYVLVPQTLLFNLVDLRSAGDSASDSLTNTSKADATDRFIEIYDTIYDGAESFLKANNTPSANISLLLLVS